MMLAERDVKRAQRVYADYRHWAERLQPYFREDPAMSVATALERYEADARSERERRTSGKPPDGL